MLPDHKLVDLDLILEGTVIKIIEPFGALVAVDDGPDLFVHISKISERRLERVAHGLQPMQRVRGRVIPGRRPGERQLSLKDVDRAPLPPLPAIGTESDGIVRDVTSTGAWVEVYGRRMLLHRKQMSETGQHSPLDLVSAGDTIRVTLAPGYDQHPVMLSAKHLAAGRPVTRIEIGSNVLGTVETIWDNGEGAIVRVHRVREADGSLVDLTEPESLTIHKSKLAEEWVTDVNDWLTVGQDIEAKLEMDRQGRVQLSMLPMSKFGALARFAQLGPTYRSWIPKLAGMAQPESWEYANVPGGYPLLDDYVRLTFAKLHDELEDPRVLDGPITQMGNLAAFNTGLMTDAYEDIYALFLRAREPDPGTSAWIFRSFVERGNRELVPFGKYLPPPATYFHPDEFHLLHYDLTLDEPEVSAHMVRDRRLRLPKDIRDGDDSYVKRQLQAALDQALFRVRMNYKIAVPEWYRGRLALLLPLDFSKNAEERKQAVESRSMLALPITRETDAKGRPCYRAATCLPLDWGYRYARLIARQDREWLVPYTAAPRTPSAEGEAAADMKVR